MKLNNNDDSHNSGLNLLIYNMLLDIESHPAWVCGLKHCIFLHTSIFLYVTPCVGVWIETPTPSPHRSSVWSHPAWVCGLKQRSCQTFRYKERSHPAWVCGLKQTCIVITIYYSSHTLRGCVD